MDHLAAVVPEVLLGRAAALVLAAPGTLREAPMAQSAQQAVRPAAAAAVVAEVEALLRLRARVFPSTPRHKVAAAEVAAKALRPQVLLPV